MKKAFIWTLLVVVLDQVTKALIRAKLPLYTSVPVFGELLRLTHVRNTGAGFSLSFGTDSFNRILFMIVNALAGVLFIYLIIKSKNRVHALCYALILGGDIGNLIDRIFLGGVTDFMDNDFPNFIMERWPIWNVADSSIFCALVIYFIYSLFFEPKTEKHAPEVS
jgi:signal peptidase II